MLAGGIELKKRYVVLAIVLISLLAIVLLPKYFIKGDKKVKYKVLETAEVPEKIKEILPKYLSDERALGCRLEDDIYVLVTRGEKQTGGYTVEVEAITSKESKEDDMQLTVHAKFKDPDVNDIVAQGFTYPFTVVKTNLKEMPEKIELKIEYEEP